MFRRSPALSSKISKRSFLSASLLLGVVGLCAPAWAFNTVEIVGPTSRLAKYSVSPRGVHLATILPAADLPGKVDVLFDGVAGPAFDEVLPVRVGLNLAATGTRPGETALVVFSRDGRRWSYLARAGNEAVLLVDGRERLRIPLSSGAARSSWHLSFTGETGRHLILLRGDQAPAELWIDGVSRPAIDAGGMAISRDGARTAYATTVGGRTTLMIDGVEAGYAAAQPQFTADGAHVIGIGRSSRGESLLDDGQSLYTTKTIERVVPSPVGRGFIVVARYFYNPDDPMWTERDRPAVERYAALYPDGDGDFLAVNGEPARWSLGTGATIGRVIYSPDGQRYAAVCTKPNAQYVFIDGKLGSEFARVIASSVTFSADSSRIGYIASREGETYAVIDGKPSPVPDGTFVVRFSADAKHFGCCGAEAVVDGQPTGLRGDLTFSPDGTHVLVTGWSVADDKTGLYLDGRLVYENSRGVLAWAFSADSQHLYWLASEPDDKLDGLEDFVTYADGNVVGRVYDVPAAAALVKAISQTASTEYGRASSMWALAANGQVQVLGPQGDQVIRLMVNPPRDTTLASLFEPRPETPEPSTQPDEESFSDTMARLHNQIMRQAAAKDAAATQPAKPDKH